MATEGNLSKKAVEAQKKAGKTGTGVEDVRKVTKGKAEFAEASARAVQDAVRGKTDRQRQIDAERQKTAAENRRKRIGY